MSLVNFEQDLANIEAQPGVPDQATQRRMLREFYELREHKKLGVSLDNELFEFADITHPPAQPEVALGEVATNGSLANPDN